MGIFRKSDTPQKDDEIEKFYLNNHVLLLEFSRILLEQKDYYENVYVNQEQIFDYIKKYRPGYNFTRHDLDATLSHLNITRFLELYYGKTEDGNIAFVKATEKGIEAIMSGRFMILQDKRRIEIENLEMIRSQTDVNKRQKWTNWLLFFATALAAVMPWFVALKFPPTVNVPAQEFRPDIRIDSVWLRGEIERALKNKAPTQPQVKAK